MISNFGIFHRIIIVNSPPSRSRPSHWFRRPSNNTGVPRINENLKCGTRWISRKLCKDYSVEGGLQETGTCFELFVMNLSIDRTWKQIIVSTITSKESLPQLGTVLLYNIFPLNPPASRVTKNSLHNDITWMHWVKHEYRTQRRRLQRSFLWF